MTSISDGFILRAFRHHEKPEDEKAFHENLGKEEFPYYYCWVCGKSTGRKQRERREARKSLA